MNEVFGDLPEAMRNTCEILDKIELYSIDHAPIMPFYPIPEDFGTEEALRQSISEEDLFKSLLLMKTEKINYLLRRERRRLRS